MPVTTPESYQELIEKGLAHPDLKAPIAEPPPPIEGPDPNRLCSPDGTCGHSDDGCRRTETILAWEKENSGKYLPANLEWGARDLFFRHEGSAWYYKPYLESLLEEDKQAKEADAVNPEYQEFIKQVKEIVPSYDVESTATLDDIRNLIQLKPNGMPNFVKETEHFFQFEDVGTDIINSENIDRQTLMSIEDTFTSDYTPRGFDPMDSLYKKDGKIYWTDLLRWNLVTDPLLRPPGVALVGPDSYNYYTHVWSTKIPDNIKQLITLAGTWYAKDFNKPFKIVNI